MGRVNSEIVGFSVLVHVAPCPKLGADGGCGTPRRWVMERVLTGQTERAQRSPNLVEPMACIITMANRDLIE